jgi:lipopolysaccharide export system permease protein
MRTRADRYLERELIRALAAVLLVLMLVVLGGLLTDVLNKIARGRVPPGLLFSQIGLRIPEALALLLPLASMVAILLSYGRLYRDSEMAVLAASGYGTLSTLRPLIRIGLVLVALQALLALYLAPLGRAVAAAMIVETQRSVAIAGLSSGRFVELPGQAGVLYVARVSEDAREVEDVLLAREREGHRLVLTARRGLLEIEGEGEELVLKLLHGERVDGQPGQPNYRRIRFEEALIAIPRRIEENDEDPLKARKLRALLADGGIEAMAELTRRLVQPLVLLLLLLLAPVMAEGTPRQPRSGRVVMAVLLYITYTNLTELARVWALTGTTPTWLGVWWVHAGFAAVVAGVWARTLLAWRRGRRLLALAGVR